MSEAEKKTIVNKIGELIRDYIALEIDDGSECDWCCGGMDDFCEDLLRYIENELENRQ